MNTVAVNEAFSPSDNVARMQGSATLAAMQAAQAMRAQGLDVVDLGPGEPDFDTPDNIKNAAIEALLAGHTKYTATAGVKQLQEAIINFYAREFNAAYEPSQVMATSGGKQAIFNAVVTLCGPGDEVLLPAPYWVTFPEIVTFARATPVYIDTLETDFVLNAEQVAHAVTPRTKLAIINSPSNPSGRVIPPAEFRRIMEVLAERGVYVITDECYQKFVYPPADVFSAASLPAELRERLCVAGSFSKTYAMTGWRAGYTLASPAWTKAMLKVQSHSTSNVTSFVQYAAAEAFNGPQNSVKIMLAEYQKRRDWLIGALNELPGVSCAMPEGAFYAFPDVRGCLHGEVKTSADFADKLLRDTQTVVTDGAGFGTEGFVRLSYATSLERLQEGVNRIRRVAEQLAGLGSQSS
jgi:aspartate aminotransferase